MEAWNPQENEELFSNRGRQSRSLSQRFSVKLKLSVGSFVGGGHVSVGRTSLVFGVFWCVLVLSGHWSPSVFGLR